MNISIRTLLITLLLGLPLVIGAYTYLYSIEINKERITSEAHGALIRTLGQRAETLSHSLSQQNLPRVHREISQISESPDIRHAILYGDDHAILASSHIADRGRSIEKVLKEEVNLEAAQILEELAQRTSSTRLATWDGTKGDAIYGITPVIYTGMEESMRPNKLAYLLIHRDLSYDLNASRALANHIILAQFLLSFVVVLLIYYFVISRFNILKKLAHSVLNIEEISGDTTFRDEITLFDNTVKHLAHELSRATEKIKEQNRFTLNVINSIEEGIFGIDIRGNITFVNRAFLSLLGYQSESEVLGKNMHQLIFHSHRNGDTYLLEDSPIHKSMDSINKVSSDQEVFWRADNNYLEVEYWASMLMENEQLSGAVITFVDITERRKIQNELIVRDAAIANSVQGIVMADMDGKIFYVNRAMIEMWAYDSSEEMIGLNTSALWKDTEQAAKSNDVVIRQNKVTTEMVALRKDSSSFDAHLSLSISSDPNGLPLCVMGSFLDISVQKETEASLIRSEETYTRAEAITHIGSWDWNILKGDLHWTDEIYRIFGQPPQSFGATYDAFVDTIHPDDRDKVGEAVGASVADVNVPYNIEHRVVRPDGEVRFVNERGEVYRNDNGEPIRMIGTVHDITEKYLAEKELEKYRQNLELLVENRTIELKKKANELVQATKLKSEFLANMSHELRTPMNSIIGFTARVIKKESDRMEPRQLENLRKVERNAHHLLGLINGLLDLSKIESGKMEAYADSFEIATLVHEVFTLTQSMLDDKPVVLNTDLPAEALQVKTDNTKLKQILINLVSNAIKFTQEGSITIAAELLDAEYSDGHRVAIRVIDTGVGMNEDALQYIFEAFRQVDGEMTRKVGGTGLGLAIVSRFTELLGGTITVRSKEGVGTCFELIIPVNLDRISGESKPLDLLEPDEPTNDQPVILCIDDEVESLELLRDYLTDEGFGVLTATNAKEGLVLAKQSKPFAITLDILMPGMDGWSALNELKKDSETLDIPVFIISFMDNKALGYELGASNYMQKPISPEQLINSIHRLTLSQLDFALVVDDDPSARELMSQILEDANITCEMSVDGIEALSLLERAGNKLPGLIILDLMMPKMDGFELLQKLQKSPVWAEIPVIVVTAKSLADHEIDFLRPHVASIIAKEGLSSERVLKQLRRAMKNHEPKPST